MSRGRAADAGGPAPGRDERGSTGPQVVGVVVVVVVVLTMMIATWSGGSSGSSPFLIMLAVAPVVLAIGYLHQRHRTRLATAWATSVGWTYVGSDPSLTTRWRGTPFGVGRSPRTSEVVHGRYRGRPAVSFGYTYTTGSGKNRRQTTWHVLAIDLPAFLPTLELTPDGFGAKLAKGFGGQDIQLESEDFNQVWRVQARAAKFAHDVLTPRTMERLLESDARGMTMRIEGASVLTWRLRNPEYTSAARRLDVLCALADAVPRFVWLDHGYDPASATGPTAPAGPTAAAAPAPPAGPAAPAAPAPPAAPAAPAGPWGDPAPTGTDL